MMLWHSDRLLMLLMYCRFALVCQHSVQRTKGLNELLCTHFSSAECSVMMQEIPTMQHHLHFIRPHMCPACVDSAFSVHAKLVIEEEESTLPQCPSIRSQCQVFHPSKLPVSVWKIVHWSNSVTLNHHSFLYQQEKLEKKTLFLCS